MTILATSEPGFLLGQRKSGDRLAASRARQPAPLVGIAEQTDRAGTESLHGESEIGKRVVPCQRFANETERAHVERRGGVGIGRGMLEPTVTAELADQIAASRIDIGIRTRKIRRAPGFDPGGERAVALLEERPAEESLVRH